MKREELMINDMVFDYTNSPVKVCAVGQDIVVKNSFGVGSLEPKELSPIPLTEEILVKNGFKKESQTIDGDYCKYTLPGFALNWCDTDGFWYQNGDITPNHVHQLQHLLRLAGIEKEIEL